MKESNIRLIEAWFDGEATPGQTRRVEVLLREDSDARSYAEKLEETRKQLRHSHPPQAAPRSWSTVKTGYSRNRGAKPVGFPRMAAAAAAIVVMGMALWWPLRQLGIQPESQALREVSVEFVETDLEGGTPVVYLDQASGWTVILVVEDSDPS